MADQNSFGPTIEDKHRGTTVAQLKLKDDNEEELS